MSDEAPIDGEDRPFVVTALLVGFAFVAVTALWGGVALVAAPDGSRVDAVIDVDLTHLEGTPFADYTVPGLILVVAVGVGSAVAAYALFDRSKWAWQAAVTASLVLIGWIAVEVALIGYVSPLQPAYALLGLAMLVAAATPSVRAFYRDRG